MEQYVMKNQKRLRCGITTGTCAVAAANAAAMCLLMHVKREQVSIYTPKGITVEIPVIYVDSDKDRAEYKVIKDSGDDPDVTNHAEICVCVERADRKERKNTYFSDERYPKLYLDGGIGVGRVTKRGLEQKIGQAAINKVPRKMLFEAVGEVCRLCEYEGQLLITVFVPEGEHLAEKTFNPKLGIEGGISILGTSGILEPMSEKAIVDTIETEIRQLHAQGETRLLVTPGNYGQSYASEYVKLSLQGSVKCSNYIGETLDLAVGYGMESLLLIGNIGKLVKLAAGIMNTHSKAADGRCEIFAVHTVLCGGTGEMVKKLMTCINTEEMLQYLEEWGLREAVIQSICARIKEYVTRRTGGKLRFGILLFSESFGFLGETEGSSELVEEYRERI